jgi:hypothetical protein
LELLQAKIVFEQLPRLNTWLLVVVLAVAVAAVVAVVVQVVLELQQV